MAAGSGRVGGYYNYFLELHWALAVLAAISLHEWGWEASLSPSKKATAIQGLALLQVALGGLAELPPTLYSPWQYLNYETLPVLRGAYPKYLDRGLSSALLQPWLDHYPGPLLVENMGNVLVLGHRPWMCDPVYFYFLSQSGKWNEQELIDRIERREFPLMVFQVAEGNLRFSPRVMQAVLKNYSKVAEAAVDSIYRPRTTAGTP